MHPASETHSPRPTRRRLSGFPYPSPFWSFLLATVLGLFWFTESHTQERPLGLWPIKASEQSVRSPYAPSRKSLTRRFRYMPAGVKRKKTRRRSQVVLPTPFNRSWSFPLLPVQRPFLPNNPVVAAAQSRQIAALAPSQARLAQRTTRRSIKRRRLGRRVRSRRVVSKRRVARRRSARYRPSYRLGRRVTRARRFRRRARWKTGLHGAFPRWAAGAMTVNR